MRQKLYFEDRAEAHEAATKRRKKVFVMPNGTRHHGMYFVGDDMEFLNFAN